MLSTGRLQQQTTLNHTNWAAKQASGFTGPPVETGATLPYRETPRPANFGPTGLPPVSLSRSVTSGARQVQAGLQPSKPVLSINLQPTIPLLSSADSRSERFSTPRSEPANQVLQAATQSAIPHLVPSGLSHLPQPHLPHGTHQNAPPLPGISASAGAFELPTPSAQAQAGLTGSPGSFMPQILTASSPFQDSVLQGSDPAGAAACANEAALLSQPLDSLNSTASKIRSKVIADGDIGAADSDAVADNPAAFLKDAPSSPESPVKADHHHDLHVKHPEDQQQQQQQQPVEKHAAEVNAFRKNRKTPCSNQSSMPDQERQQQPQQQPQQQLQQQHEVGHSGSEEYHYAWDDHKAGKDVPDGGSDSMGTFKDGKRCRWASLLLWTILTAVSASHNTGCVPQFTRYTSDVHSMPCSLSAQYLSARELIRQILNACFGMTKSCPCHDCQCHVATPMSVSASKPRPGHLCVMTEDAM